MSTRSLPGNRRSFLGSHLRPLLVGCGALAIVVAIAAQLAVPSSGNVVVSWAGTVLVPGAIVLLMVANRRDSTPLLVLTCGLLYVEVVFLALLYEIAMAFAILLPLIGISFLQLRVRGPAKLGLYAAAGLVATVTIVLVEAHVPTNSLGRDDPVLTVVAFMLVATFGLGVTWYSGEQLIEAYEATRRELRARSAAERRLRETAQTLERLNALSPLPTMAFDEAGRVQLWNPAAERLFGWPAAEVVAQPSPFGRVGRDGERDLRACIEQTLEGATASGELAVARAKDGRELIVEVHSANRYDPDSHTRGVIVQAIDVTERRALEDQLRQAQKMEAVGQLAGGVAHDINNTLTAVGGFADMIASTTREPETAEDARTIMTAVQRGAELTSRLLAFARRSMLRPQRVEPGAFCRGVLPMIGRLLGADVRVTLADESDGAAVHVDPGQLEQALVNLAVNARDAMFSGGILSIAVARVEAGLTEGADPTACVSIAVSDTGVGMAPDVQSQAFEPFFTTKPHGRGTGLGLAMVYGFVSQSGGTVRLRSAEGEGTTVEILLPQQDAPIPAEPEADPAPHAQSAGNETILLVDDTELIAELGRKSLAGLGYDVLVAHDGSEATELARRLDRPLALIVSDVIMPGLTGPETVEAVRALHPEAAALFMSGYTADAISERGMLPAGVDILQKPYSPATLAARVRAAIDGSRPGTPDGAENGDVRRNRPDS